MATVHRSTMQILAGQDVVFQEGLTERNAPTVAAEIKSLAAFHLLLRKMSLDDADHELKLLRLGAAAELMLDGNGPQLLPADDHAAHEAARAKPFDDATLEVRRKAIVTNVTARGKSTIVVLGGGHDLRADLAEGPPRREVARTVAKIGRAANSCNTGLAANTAAYLNNYCAMSARI